MRDQNDTNTLDITMNSLVGYARVSTKEQNMEMQIDALQKSGCHKIFSDIASGAKSDRPGLDEAIGYLRPGDTLVVWKIDRLGRSLPHLVQTIDKLSANGVSFKSINDPGIDTTTKNGKLLFNLFGTLAEFERDLIRERTKAGLVAAIARGRHGGRKPVMNKIKLEKAKKLIDEKGLTVREAAVVIKVGKTALYNAIKNFKKKL